MSQTIAVPIEDIEWLRRRIAEVHQMIEMPDEFSYYLVECQWALSDWEEHGQGHHDLPNSDCSLCRVR
jgi:hypothetical protein